MAELAGLGADALAIRRARVGIESAVIAVIGAAVVVLLPRFTDWSVPWWVVVALVAANGVVSLWWASVEFERWRWRLDDELLEVRRGVVVRRTSLVPRNRIQNVTTTVGPLQRRFGVVTVTVHTAGTRTPNVAIEDLDAGHAERIRRQLGLV
ncbi:MAG TPA: PH domain-containing protein [Acidimicrobiia bacterium]|nr:PH domain-containing protein [Acidimicrobiia bacterium]